MALGLCQGKIRRLRTGAELEKKLLQEQGLGMARGLEGEVGLVNRLQPFEETIQGEAGRSLEQVEGAEGVHVEESGRRPVVPVPWFLQAGKNTEAERLEQQAGIQLP